LRIPGNATTSALAPFVISDMSASTRPFSSAISLSRLVTALGWRRRRDYEQLFRGLERLGEFRHIDNFDVYEAVRTVRSVSIYFELLREDTAQYFRGRFRRAGKAWTLGYAIERHAGVD
jgi:hypothetical protein